jgi:WD40 repeat protein
VDKVIQVWDSGTGGIISRPFEDPTESIFSVAFSQDSKHIISGSFDNAIRVWDADTGAIIAGPFDGHIDHINSVVFVMIRLSLSTYIDYFITLIIEMTLTIFEALLIERMRRRIYARTMTSHASRFYCTLLYLRIR